MAKPSAIHPVTKSKFAKVGIYGPPGCGKTRFIGTGAKTLILRPPTDHTDSIRGGDPEEWVVSDWEQMTGEVFEFLQQDAAQHFKWVWLDSVSLFQDHSLDAIWEAECARYPHRKEYGLDKGEYGRNMERLERWIRDVIGLDSFNFGFTGHTGDIELYEETKLGPYIQGKKGQLSQKICGYMNMVGFMKVEQIRGHRRRVIHFRETDEYIAKDQFDAVPNGRLVDPTMPKLIAALKEARGSEGSTRTRAGRKSTKRRRSARRRSGR